MAKAKMKKTATEIMIIMDLLKKKKVELHCKIYYQWCSFFNILYSSLRFILSTSTRHVSRSD